jgi:hypothetical protein
MSKRFDLLQKHCHRPQVGLWKLFRTARINLFGALFRFQLIAAPASVTVSRTTSFVKFGPEINQNITVNQFET